MEKHKELRKKIREFIIEEYQMGSPNFFMHGEGGDHFPYEEDDNAESAKKERENKKEAQAMGMDTISGDSLHLTGANM